jgi:hypothetical protein
MGQVLHNEEHLYAFFQQDSAIAHTATAIYALLNKTNFSLKLSALYVHVLCMLKS